MWQPGAHSSQPDDLNDSTFLVRQPVFDAAKVVRGYEICCQAQSPEGPAATDQTLVTRRIIHQALNVIGLQSLLGGKKMFMNATAETLIEEDHAILPAEYTILSPISANAPTPDLLNSCRQARQAGYGIAVPASSFQSLIDIAHIVKIDWQRTPGDTCRSVAKHFLLQGLTLLAYNVDGHDAFDEAANLGFKYFHGTFFCHPEVFPNPTLTATQTIQLQLIAELSKPGIDFKTVEEIVKRDVFLSVGLLKFVNSAAIGTTQHVTSLRQVLTLLGERHVKKWATLAAIGGLCRDKPHELMVTGLVRAYFCESIGLAAGVAERDLDLYLIGLLSVLDALVDMPMQQVIESVPLSEDVRAVLLGDRTSQLGQVFALAQASERGAWVSAISLGAQMHLTQRQIAERYYDALRRVHDLFT